MRQAQPRPAKRNTDYLSVALPSDADPARTSAGPAASVNRKSRASTYDVLHNPFGPDEHDSEDGSQADEEMEEMEVDLASWGLDALMTKEKDKSAKAKGDKSSRKQRARTRSETFAALRAGEPVNEFGEQPGAHNRAMSLGNFGGFGLGGAFLEAESSAVTPEARPHSVASPDDLVKMTTPQRPPHTRRASEHLLIDNLPHPPPLHSVPFPQATSPSQPEESGARPASRYALPSQILANLNNQAGGSSEALRDRKRSTLSVGSQNLLRDDPDVEIALQQRNSRTFSVGSREMLADENNPFAVRPPSPSRMSRFDPKMAARARTASVGSLGSRQLLDNDAVSTTSGLRDRPYSKWDLMRPKVLVMPSPLQDTLPVGPSGPQGRDGFMISSDLPLPPGARASKRGSVALDALQPPNPGSAFTPNPRSMMSLSQLTFRNTLMVDGRPDSTYADLSSRIPRATAEGEQVEIPDDDEVPVAPIPVVVDEPEEQGPPAKRPAGKLYGRSLIDNLEARKIEMRNKQRLVIRFPC
jgi:hypothetical protein